MKKLNRREFIALGAGASLSFGLGAACSQNPNSAGENANPAAVEAHPNTAPPQKPNIVLVILDTIRADKLGCYGFKHSTSPELDRLAKSGVRFDRVISQSSWTRPSTGSFLTSRYARDLGLYKELNEIINDKFDTLAKVLKKSGYATFGATANPNLNAVFNFHKGFDEYKDSLVVFDWMLKQDGLTPEKEKAQKEERKLRNLNPLPTAPDMFRAAMEWAQKQDKDKPKFVQINAMEVHEWYMSRTMIRDEYANEFMKSGERHPKYLQSVRQLTDDVGKFVDELGALPGWDNTLFAVISDHGEGLHDHGVAKDFYHGYLLYETQVSVPWVLYHKNWKPPVSVVTQPVRLLELMPTLLDFAGVAAPEGVEGKSMHPLLTGAAQKVELPEAVFTETNWKNIDSTAVYMPDWKFVNNKVVLEGWGKEELQLAGQFEKGAKSSKEKQNPEIFENLSDTLSDWMNKHPKAEPTPISGAMPDEMLEQMDAIGYLGE